MFYSIPMSECKDRWLYLIIARNLSLGVFGTRNSGFIGLREKFDEYRLDTEYHRESGGTAAPREALCELPAEIVNRTSLETICGACRLGPAAYVPWDDGPREHTYADGHKATHEGRWMHTAIETLAHPKEDVFGMSVGNKPLFDWLKEMEKKYADKIETRWSRPESAP